MSSLTGTRIVVANWRDLDHSLAGGAERYAWEFARALREAGARVDFVTAREAGQSRRATLDGIRIHRGGGRLGFFLFAAWFLLTRRRSIDAVVDADCGLPVFAPWWVRRDVPVVLLVHHVHHEQFRTYFPAPVAQVAQFVERRVMPRAYARARALAVSESTRHEMLEQLAWAGPIAVLPNGNHGPLSAAVDPLDTIDRVAVVGRLSPHKRVDLVIRAVTALAGNRPALHLDVVGKGPELAHLRALVEELEAEKHVTVHGYLDEPAKAAVLARARLHVCASDVEGWGQVVLEAASYGVPTVARDVPGLRDSVRHETTGWLLDEVGHDLGAVQARLLVGIESALDELDDPVRREEIAAECRAWAAQFSWTQMRADAVRVVREAVKNRSTTP